MPIVNDTGGNDILAGGLDTGEGPGDRNASMRMDDDIADLIGGLYDAALGDAAWPDVLARLSARVGGEGILLNHFSLRGQEGGVVLVDIDPASLRAYDDHYRDINPLRLAIQRLPPGDTVFIDRMLVPGADLDRTEFYSDFLAPQDQHSTLCLSTTDHAGQPACIGIWRSRRRPPWGKEEMRLLRQLGPHLGRALRADRRLGAEARRRAVLTAAMDRPLSRRERDCLACIAGGATSRTAAAELGLSVLTVDDYLASAMAKLGAATRAEAVALALMLGRLDR